MFCVMLVHIPWIPLPAYLCTVTTTMGRILGFVYSVISFTCYEGTPRIANIWTLSDLGRKKTIHRVRSQFHWRGLQHDVANFVRSCERCQKRKALQPWRSGYLQLFSATEPFQIFGIDLLGPFLRSLRGNIYAVVMLDRSTRWPELAAIPNATAEAVADAVIDKLVLRHGCPVQL